uniref:Putative ovule protein n=1 Tax=Solanum chacoense TaxID=4108 RepID=A0A0V0HE54_SOLCH
MESNFLTRVTMTSFSIASSLTYISSSSSSTLHEATPPRFNSIVSNIEPLRDISSYKVCPHSMIWLFHVELTDKSSNSDSNYHKFFSF